MRHITPRELQTWLRQDGDAPLLLDVREPWEFHTCHIEDSQLIPMGRIAEAVSTLDQERDIVVICHHGIRSRQVAYYLERMGFGKVINLTGGVDAWARDVDPQMAVY